MPTLSAAASSFPLPKIAPAEPLPNQGIPLWAPATHQTRECQPIADLRGGVICPPDARPAFCWRLDGGGHMRWNDQARHNPAAWCGGALLLVLVLAGCASKPSSPP